MSIAARVLPRLAAALLAAASGYGRAAVFEASVPAAASSAGEQQNAPSVRNAWSRATAPGATVGVAYFEVVNGNLADELLGIESPAAGRVEMHGTTTVNGMMAMRPADSVAVPADGRVVFEPGGMHAMLIDLKQPLKAGAHLTLTLKFRRAGRVATSAVVQDPGAMSGPAPPAAAAAAESAGFHLAIWPQRAKMPDFTLHDTGGRLRRLADYRGRVVIVYFGFMRCPDACPAELFKLAMLMQRLGPAAAQVQVLFVTLDPARDTRRLLQRYVTAFDARFIGLTGSAAQIDRAAGNFHVDYARVPAGPGYTIDHSTSTFVLDTGGRLRLVGTPAADVADYAHDLGLLAAE